MQKLYISDLKKGDLILPENNLGWKFRAMSDDSSKICVTTVSKGWSDSCSPGVYLGKTRFSKPIDGLKTWHELILDGVIYLMEGYESSRIQRV